MPMTARPKSPALMAAANTKNLAKNPASGGTPASESRSIANKNAMGPLVRARPAKSEMVSTGPPSRRIARMQANAERHGHIDRDVDQDTLHTLARAGGETHQGEAHVADRGIGH